jgi:uncharacterized protein YdeI (YjbR/CyaY-like superfamily)
LLFFKGALLNDTQRILVQQSAIVQAQRQIRFSDALEIIQNEHAIRQYILDAIDIERAGSKVNLKRTSEFLVVDEFQKKLNDEPDLKAAFESLTPGRQRAYLLHFSQATQSKTREVRIQKCIPLILNGRGLND